MRRKGPRGLAIPVAALACLALAAPAAAKTRSIPDSGLVAIGKVRCEASEACLVLAPKQISAKVAGKAVRAKVVVPRFLGRGGKAKVKLRFAADALALLAGHSASFRVRVVVRAGGRAKANLLSARLRRRSSGGGGSHGAGEPHSEPISGEPLVMARPATAVTVSGVRLTWYPRDSWLRYIAAGVSPGDGTTASGGAAGIDATASPCPDRPAASSAELPYTIEFAPGESWFDPPSGTADVTGVGSVSFRYRAHTIDLTGSEPEIQIAGSASQAIFRFSGSEGTYYPNQRVALLSLNSAGQPTVSGSTYTYTMMRGRLTPDGEKVFAGFYAAPADNEFGCVSVQFTVS